MWLLIVVLLVLALLGGPYTGWHHYGWGPSGIVWVLLVVLLILVLTGRL